MARKFIYKDCGGVSVTEAAQDDIYGMLDDFRKMDAQEVMSSHGMTPQQALEYSYSISSDAYTLFVEDKPAAMFGIARDPVNLIGGVWLLGTNRTKKVKKTFMKLSRAFIEKWLRENKYVYNHVDERQTQSIKWLKWCGAKFNGSYFTGIDKTKFLSFTIERGK